MITPAITVASTPPTTRGMSLLRLVLSMPAPYPVRSTSHHTEEGGRVRTAKCACNRREAAVPELNQLLRHDWLLLNRTAVRNALVASAQAAQRSAERLEVERTLLMHRDRELSGAG